MSKVQVMDNGEWVRTNREGWCLSVFRDGNFVILSIHMCLSIGSMPPEECVELFSNLRNGIPDKYNVPPVGEVSAAISECIRVLESES